MSKNRQRTSIIPYIRQLANGDLQSLDPLIQTINEPSIDEEDLRKYFIELRDNVSVLNKEIEVLVGVLLKVDLLSKPNAVIQEYQSLLVNLISAHPYYLQATCRRLVILFLPADDVKDEQKANYERVFELVHQIIKSIADIAPLFPKILVPILTLQFPFMKKSLYKHTCYVSNLLKICKYLPSVRCEILEIIIDKLLRIDVSSPKHEIKESLTELEEAKMEEELIFQMEEVHSEKPSTAGPMTHDLANKLDCLLDLLLTYIHDTCFQNGDLNWEVTRQLYKELLYSFDKIILPTHASCHVQFIMFYICSFKQALYEAFLEYLWKKTQNPNTATILRQNAISYIASLLSRAKYINTRTIVMVLDLLVPWVHRYIDHQTGSIRAYVDINIHGTFYYICQTIFYIFAFRHKELIKMPRGIKYLQSLNLERIVHCRLNPLKVCVPSVIRNFSSITRSHQLVYCHTIIERNNRILLPVINMHNELANINPLDCFFPFDPYLLIRSGRYILPLYSEFEGNILKENVKAANKMEDDDDFLEDKTLNAALQGSQIFEDIFMEDASPGFRNIIPSP